MMSVSATNDLRRLRDLIETHDGDLISPHDAELADLADDDARFDREKRVVTLIRLAFTRLNLPVSPDRYAITYDETPDREAEVRLEEGVHGVSLADLTRLSQSGLAEDFRLVGGEDGITVRFRVTDGLETAKISAA